MLAIPSSFTLLRLLLVGWAAAILIIHGMWSPIHPVRFAAAILILAALTDAIDGYLARKLRVPTTLGGYFDHLVDLSLTGVLLYQGYMMLNQDIMKIYILFQVLTMTIGFYQFQVKNDTCWPNLYGKVSYVIFIFGICVAMILTGTAQEEAAVKSANVILVMSIMLRILAFLSYWKYLEQHDFFWRGEADQKMAKEKRKKEEEQRPV
ncbi:MAG: CDP-alcohol phosphatidyltransferase family protein [Candidatus Pacebacteria bacterium]|nr:CDP-alcohol phosphatidyltransferase family protein [Candidatus Paceibacterota bacterium]